MISTLFYKHALVLLDDFLNGRRHERVHVVETFDVRLLFFFDGLDAFDSFAVFGKVALGDDRRVDLSSVVLVLKCGIQFLTIMCTERNRKWNSIFLSDNHLGRFSELN